jgi:hypothetical protein
LTNRSTPADTQVVFNKEMLQPTKTKMSEKNNYKLETVKQRIINL